MASKTESGPHSSGAKRRTAAAPVFEARRETAQLPVFEVQPAAMIEREPEPEIVQGIDLSGRAKILMAAGRGKTGKTTLLRWAAEQSLEDGRTFLMADIDPTNASFAAYFEGVSRPRDDDPLHVRDWLQRFIEYAVAHQYSALIDLGGGHTTLRAIAAEMPGFDAMIEEAGLTVAMFYLVGPHPEDLTPIATLTERGFIPPARAIVLNEGTAPIGRLRVDAFGRVTPTALFKNRRGTRRGAVVDAALACRRSDRSAPLRVSRGARRPHRPAARPLRPHAGPALAGYDGPSLCRGALVAAVTAPIAAEDEFELRVRQAQDRLHRAEELARLAQDPATDALAALSAHLDVLAGHHRLEKERINARLEVVDSRLDEVHQLHAELRELTAGAAAAARAEIGKAQADIAREAAQQIAGSAAQQLKMMTRTSWLRAVTAAVAVGLVTFVTGGVLGFAWGAGSAARTVVSA